MTTEIPFDGMDELALRQAAGKSVRTVARVIAEIPLVRMTALGESRH